MLSFPGSKKHELVRIEGRPGDLKLQGFWSKHQEAERETEVFTPSFGHMLQGGPLTSYTYRSPITAGGPPTLYQVSWTFCLRKSLGKFYEPNRLGIPAQWWLIVRGILPKCLKHAG